MVDFKTMASSKRGLAVGAAILVALGAAGGAGAVQATRPPVEMAPTVQTPIARLVAGDGVVTIKGRVAEVFGDRFVVQDGTGRAMVAAGRDAQGTVAVGQTVTVQGRFDNGQLRASYLVDANGRVAAVGGPGPRHGGPGGHKGRGPDGGPPRPADCGPAAPPVAPPAEGATPPAPPAAGATPPAPAPAR